MLYFNAWLWSTSTAWWCQTVQWFVEPICLRLYIFSARVGRSWQVLGGGKEWESRLNATLNAEICSPQAWAGVLIRCFFPPPPPSPLSPSPSPLSCENLQCWKTLMHFNSSFTYTIAQYSSAFQWKGLSMALIWLFTCTISLWNCNGTIWSQLSPNP